jgi:hypothetical protein
MQKSSIACRPLADWLGQSVRFQGYLSHWETVNKTGDTAFLLRNVQVVPYKGCKEQIRVLDHIWLYTNKDVHTVGKLERLGRYAAVGRVVSYTRSNGTKDFAIDIKPYVSIESHLDLLMSYESPKLKDMQAKIIILKETLNQLEIEELHFATHLSYEEVHQIFQNDYEFCQRQVEINERYEAKKQHRYIPRTKDIKFPSAVSKSTKVAGKGFATS